MVRYAPFVFPSMPWKTSVSPNYYKRPHYSRGNPKRITSQMEGFAFIYEATA